MRLTTRSVSEQSVLVLEGKLQAADATELRRLLASTLAADPHPVVICDLTRVPSADPAAISVFAAHQTHDDGPGPVLYLAGATAHVSRALERMGLDGVVPVAPTVADAVAQAARRPPRLCAVRSLLGYASAPRLAREFALEVCGQWSVNGQVEDVALVVDELVTNAVTHARTDVVLRLERTPGRIMVAVRDGASDSFPSWWRGEDDVRTSTGADAERTPRWGLGLTIVRSLAESAGVHADSAGGKVVWAVLRTGAPKPERAVARRPRRVHLTVNSGRGTQPDASSWVVQLELAWFPDEPAVVLVGLTSRPRHPSVPQGIWRVARSSLRDGMRAPVRDHGMRLWPERKGHQLVLEVPSQPAHVVRVSASRVTQFLDSTEASGRP
jgi:anti-anti-sigma factor